MADRDLTGRTLGDFVLREQIGEGGWAAVYRGEQPVLAREVVIKVLHQRRQTSETAKDRFLREAQLASRLDHPYAAHVYAFGIEEEDGLQWIAMELVQGITLSGWLELHGSMPLEQFVPFFECIAEVVQAAHDRGIIHRDLKPSNMMVIERGGRLFPKLLDFGIAKVTPEPGGATEVVTAQMRPTPRREPRTRTDEHRHDLTRRGIGLGSAPYMSPEQWTDASTVGPATDIYSLGIIAYEALTGRRPFTAERTRQYHQQHRFGDVPPLGGTCLPDLDPILQRALDKRPAARHGTVRELASELRAALRASDREQLRTSAQQWADRAREPGLLWAGGALAKLQRWASHAPSGALTHLECSFLADCQRRARRGRWVRRLVVALAALGVLGVLRYRATTHTRMIEQQARAAQQVAEAAITQAELEQGRAALLHGEPEAQRHLTEAYRRDSSPSTAFMLARALQPRLAEQARFASSSGRMWSAVYSPDGTQIATTDDGGVQVHDAATGTLRFALPCGDTVYQAVYSADGTRLVAAAGAGSVKIWDAARGTLVRELHRAGTSARYYAVAISPDGTLVAAIDTKGDLAHLWNAITGEPVAEIRNDASAFPALAFSADGRWLATTGGDDVRVFDAQTRRHAVTLPGPRIRSLAFDPTGPRLLTGAATGDVAIWSVPSAVRLRHLRDVPDPVEAVAFSPDGQLVAAGSRDGAAQVWRAASGELQSQLAPRPSKILAVEFDRASKLLLAAGAEGSIVVAEAALGMPVTVLEGPQNVLVAHFDPSGRHVVGASLDGTAWVWDATSPYRRWSAPPMSDSCGIGTGLEPDRRFLAVGCEDRPTRIWDTARDQLLAELPSVSHVDGDFTSAFPAVSSAGDRAAIARGNTVEVYELPARRLLRTIAHGAAVNAVAFAPAGRDVISGAVDGSLLVTRDGGAQIVLPTAPGGIDAAGFLPDGRVVAADAQRHLRIYDRGGPVLADLALPVRVMALRTDATRLVALPIRPPIIANVAPPLLVDLERYRIITQLEGHAGRVFSARWVTGGQILTAGVDGTVRLWDGSTGQPRQVYQGSMRRLADATLTPDGLVIAAGADGLLRFWDRDSGRQLWTLQAHASLIIGIHVEGSDIVTRAFTGELARWTLPSPGQVIGACSDHERCAIVAR